MKQGFWQQGEEKSRHSPDFLLCECYDRGHKHYCARSTFIAKRFRSRNNWFQNSSHKLHDIMGDGHACRGWGCIMQWNTGSMRELCTSLGQLPSFVLQVASSSQIYNPRTSCACVHVPWLNSPGGLQRTVYKVLPTHLLEAGFLSLLLLCISRPLFS